MRAMYKTIFIFLQCVAVNIALADNAVVTIAHVGPVSGSYAFLGKDNENGAALAVDELNAEGVVIGGQKITIKLLKEDDAGDPRQGVSAAKRIVSANAVGVVGHVHSGISIPASKIYSDAGIPQITPSSTSPVYSRQGLKTAFRVIADDTQVGRALGRYAISVVGAKTVMVIDDGTTYGQGLANEFKTEVEASGASVIDRISVSDRATDFKSTFANVKGKAPEVVFFAGADSVAGPLLRQMKSDGIAAKFLGGDALCTKELIRVTSDVISDSQVICGQPGGVEGTQKLVLDDFKKKFKSKFGSEVQLYAPFAYDAVKLMVSAMVQADSTEPQKYLSKMAALHYKGVTGDIDFDNKGDVKNGTITLRTIRSGKFEEIAVVR